jgi:hypothetical protein
VTPENLSVGSRKQVMRAGKSFALFAMFFLMAAQVLHAGSLDSSVLGMFPENVSECGYADLKTARDFAWFPQFQAQVVPVSLYGFEQFLETAQMQQTPVIEQVAWARISALNTNTSAPLPGSGQLVGVAEGHFDLGAIRSFLSTRQISGLKVGDAVMYGAGTGSGAADVFFVLTSDQTIAFGSRDSLQRLLATVAGEEENLLTNEKMMGLISQVNGDDVFWGVFGAGGAQTAVRQLMPEAAKLPQARDLIGKMKDVSIAVKAPSDLELDFQATSGSPNDAQLLSQLLQVGFLYRQQQSNQSNPDLAKVLTGARVSANGNQLAVSFEVTSDQMLGLIEHDTFRMPM